MKLSKLNAVLCATAAAFAMSGAISSAQSTATGAPGYAQPKTAWGVPDLQGTWTNASITDMQRSADYPSLVMSPEQVKKMEEGDYYNNRTREDAKPTDLKTAKLLDGTDLLSGGGYNAFWVDQGTKVAIVKGEPRSSWIIEPANGRIPRKGAAAPAPARPAAGTPGAPTGAASRTGTVQGPGAVDRNSGGGFGSYDNPETRPMGERCIIGFGNTGGPVMTNVLYNNTYQIVQSPSHVMIVVEMVHDARIIPIVKSASEAKYGPGVIKKWLGDSVGWYEGNTLVVETKNVNPAQRGYISAAGKLIERFTRWNDGQITYEFTVDDPTQYSQPWKGEMALNASKEPFYEYACHEGNYAMEGILAGARKQEREGKTVRANAAEEGRSN
ncbi:MAG: hypothetical protein Q8R02_24495 [Hyphomonadaceae bacterium]|nr:hypothetical protein [Hyphomonadaceae bacterium]